MLYATRPIFFLFVILSCVLNSCTSDDSVATATVTEFDRTGLLGQRVSITLDHMPKEGVSVFFDNEPAPIVNYPDGGDFGIEVEIPRTLTSATAILKVIDAATNTDILNETFTLQHPIISSYSSSTVSFEELFTIYGSNFDTQPDAVAVYVNNEKATLINTAYDRIEIKLPTKITNGALSIKVKAQLQEAISTVPLELKAPVIDGVVNTVAWIQSQLVVTGANFNPNPEYGDVFVNGTKCYFTATPTQLSIDTPPGPYHDFKVENITYSTAGMTSSLDCAIPVPNEAVMVDHLEHVRLGHTIFEHNNKAYAFKTVDDGSFNVNAEHHILEFSSVTEQWTELSAFSYTGAIADAVYDGEETVYLYKYFSDSETYGLSKLNMNTFVETALELPNTKIQGPELFAYQGNLYLLSGLNNVNGVITVREQKYRYSASGNSWTTLPGNAFSGLPLVSSQGSGKCRYLHYGGNLYISFTLGGTYKISPSLGVTVYPYTLNFGYKNRIFGRYIGSNTALSNLETGAQIDFDYYRNGSNFFTLNGQVYCISNSWTAYFANQKYTQKLNTTILNGIL